MRVDGEERWLLAADVDELASAAPDGRTALLPAFDQYEAGAARGVDALLAAGMAGRVYRPQGWLSPVLLVDGRMAGVWRHEVKGSVAGRDRAVRQAAAGRQAGRGGGGRSAGGLAGRRARADVALIFRPRRRRSRAAAQPPGYHPRRNVRDGARGAE